jgi:hypothetical protein
MPVPDNVSSPRVVGGRRAGTVATAQLGTWSAAPPAVSYHWLRCEARCTAIPGAAGARYRVRLGDVGRGLRVLVTARNRFGSTNALSPVTRPVASPLELAAVRHRRPEWVELRNETGTRFALDGWSLRDAAGAIQILRRGDVAPHGTTRVRTRGLWRARDRATLRLPGGRAADVCAYATRAAVARC